MAFAYLFPLRRELRMSGSHAFVMGFCHSAIVSILSLQIMATNTSLLTRGIVLVSLVAQFNFSYVYS